MSTAHAPSPPLTPLPESWMARPRPTAMLRDAWILIRRDLAHLRYEPGGLLAELIWPVIMILIFGYVLGSAIAIPGGGNYRDYLLPGLFVLNQVFTLSIIAGGVANDAEAGVTDRFRSLPMSPMAVPLGITGADIVKSMLGLAITTGLGLLVGFRIHDGAANAALAFVLLILFRYAISWIGTFLGLLVSPTTADFLFPLTFPFAMIANMFVPTAGFPAWLRVVADWNPVSSAVAATRKLFGSPGAADATAWPLAHPVLVTFGWIVLILAVFMPLACWRYRTTTR
ncbi:ABC transporter permease [Amycolatopsis sp. cg13]|uniref:ABC transporter permease n=1 Tax=Amycolatopsis sp. cg13 TaxID=3238807 RepID=UPI0035245E24